MSIARPLPLAIGALLAGKYRIDAVLGQGGMGAVFAAENVDLGRQVAIKVLFGDLARDELLVKRFRQEARAAAAIGHPGIVDVLDLGTTEDGDAFIVMERLDGQTLGARMTLEGRLPIPVAAAIVAEALEALAAAHAKGIVHRDLKPDNLFLVTRPAAVKLVDFGISKLQGSDDVSITTTGVVMGTPLYMSPEQARGVREIDSATDLYSMGAILYQALCGYPPLNGQSYNELIAKLVTEEPKPIQGRRAALPPALAELVHRMLAKDPAARPSARVAAEQLRDLAGALGAVVEAAIGIGPTLPPDAPTAPAHPFAETAATPVSAAAPGLDATVAAPLVDTVSAPLRGAPSARLASVPAPVPARGSRMVAIVAIVVAAAALIALVVVMTRGEKTPGAASVPDAAPRAIAPAIDGAQMVAAPDAGPVVDAAVVVVPIDARPGGGHTPKRKVDAGAGTGTGSASGLEIDETDPTKKP